MNGTCEVCGCPPVPWLTPRQIAAAFRFSETKVRSMFASGEIPGGKVGARWLVAHKAFDRVVESWIVSKGNEQETRDAA